MQYAPPMLAAEPANGLTCGIDWARDDHAIAIVDDRGRQVHRSTVEHSAAGLRELVAVLARTKATEVAIERPDGPVVDALLGAGITVVVISPNQLKNLRGRYGSAGNKDDRFDAFVLADTLRPDCARWCPTPRPRWRCARYVGPGRRPPAHHPRPGGHPEHPGRTDQNPGQADRRATGRPCRRAHLHQPAAVRNRPRGPAVGRNRRLPCPIPHPRSTDAVAA